MDASQQHEPDILTVSQLNAQARKLLESSLGSIRLRGEVSGTTKSQAGHYYFSLKDKKSEIRCVLFASTIYRNRLGQRPEQGKEVVVDGRVTLYEPRGSYQFFVEKIELDQGKEGALYQQFLQLKKELGEQGYFSDDRKRALPPFPKCVGIVTSPTGAAVHDIIRAFKRRNPAIALIIFPTSVQGETAPQDIAAAISLANSSESVDVLLVSRGGGSLEDLAAFNDKRVADAIYTSKKPVVTGIGHQTDVSIADYIADKPLATPTAAAEHISTPSRDEMLQTLSNLTATLQTVILSKLNDQGQRVDLAQRSLMHPEQRITDLRNRFRACQEQLILLVNGHITKRTSQVEITGQQLLNRSPAGKIDILERNLAFSVDNLHRTTADVQRKLATRIESLSKQLETMNPQATLNRGYAIVRQKSDDSIITDAKQVSPGDKVEAQLATGALELDVDAVRP